MSARFSSPCWSLLLAAFALGLMPNCGQAQGSARPRRALELSETNTAEILTNLNQLATRKEGVNQLEDQLRMLKQFSARNPLEGRFNAPYVPPGNVRVLPNKTIRELLERQNNWGLTAEEMGTALGSSDPDPLAAYGESKLDPKGSSLQQFYNALDGTGNAKSGGQAFKRDSTGGSSDKQIFRDDDPSQDANLPVGIRDKAQKLRDMATTDPSSIFNSAKSRPSFDNFFGLNRPSAAPEGVRENKSSMETFMEQFKKVLEGPSAGVKLDPGLNSLLPNSAAAAPRSPYPASDQFRAPKHDNLIDSTPHPPTALVDRSTVPDFNSAILNQWNPMYAPPKLEVPRITPPTPPNLDFPRRKF